MWARTPYGRVMRFNEAGGFLPRKRPAGPLRPAVRPALSFNEAGGFLPRKPVRLVVLVELVDDASMRPGDFSPGNFWSVVEPARGRLSFNEAGGFLPRKRTPSRLRSRP